MGWGYRDWERIVPFWRVLEMIEPHAIPRATSAREKRELGIDFVEAIELRPGQAVLRLRCVRRGIQVPGGA
jgi:hypothetical protein